MCSDLDFMFKPIIMVTGFGPFTDHPVNASWEAVKILNKDEIEQKHNCELVLIEIPVTYENVDEYVPALWDTHTPKLMIHVGVSSLANCLTLEKQARRKGYQRVDYFDCVPANHTCLADGAIKIQTKLNLEKICEQLNQENVSEEIITAAVSKNAGLYLCEYIYYTSLSVDSSRTLFVHVPDSHVYSAEKTARGLQRIIDLCLQQIKEAEQASSLNDKMKNAKLNDDENEIETKNI